MKSEVRGLRKQTVQSYFRYHTSDISLLTCYSNSLCKAFRVSKAL